MLVSFRNLTKRRNLGLSWIKTFLDSWPNTTQLLSNLITISKRSYFIIMTWSTWVKLFSKFPFFRYLIYFPYTATSFRRGILSCLLCFFLKRSLSLPMGRWNWKLPFSSYLIPLVTWPVPSSIPNSIYPLIYTNNISWVVPYVRHWSWCQGHSTDSIRK